MKALPALIIVLMAGTAYGQSNLPAYQESYTKPKWGNCFRSYPSANGNSQSLNSKAFYHLSLESTTLNFLLMIGALVSKVTCNHVKAITLIIGIIFSIIILIQSIIESLRLTIKS